MEEKNTQEEKVDKVTEATKAPEAKKFPPRKSGNFRKGGKKKMSEKPKDDFDQRVLDLARVTRVMAGGKRMKFRATMVIGDKKGKVGIGIAKGADVSAAIQKAVAKARKKLIEVPIIEGTVAHEVRISDHSAKIMIRPARSGSGIKAGGVMRVVLELAGIRDVVAKILGTNNKVNNAKATIKALNSFVPQAVAASKASNKNPLKPIKANKEIQKDKESK